MDKRGWCRELQVGKPGEGGLGWVIGDTVILVNYHWPEVPITLKTRFDEMPVREAGYHLFAWHPVSLLAYRIFSLHLP